MLFYETTRKEARYFSSDFFENLDEIPPCGEVAFKRILEKFLNDFFDFLENIEKDIYNAGEVFFYDLESISTEAEEYFSDFDIYFCEKAPSTLCIAFIRLTVENHLNNQALIDEIGDTVLTYDEEYLKAFVNNYENDVIEYAYILHENDVNEKGEVEQF